MAVLTVLPSVWSPPRVAPRTTIIVAAGDLLPGIPITADDLVSVPMPHDIVPPGAITDPARLVGRIPWERVLANEPLLEERLADADSGRGTNVLVRPGMVAVALEAGNGRALRTFLRPGVHLDLLVTLEVEGREPETLPLLERIRFLTVLRSSGMIVLELTPEQAELAVHAARSGRITMAVCRDGLPERPIEGIVPIASR